MKFSIFLLLAGILLLATVMYTIFRPANPTYITSIYFGYPWYFWISLYGLYCIGLLLASFSKITEDRISGVSFMVISNCLTLLIPVFLGYFLTDNIDSATTLGYVISFQTNGHVIPQDFYPGYHILIYSISKILGVAPNEVMQISLVLFYAFYLMGVYLLSRAIFGNNRSELLALILASPLLYPEITVSVPRTYMFEVLPVILLAIVNTAKFQRSADFVALLALLAMSIISHPLNGGIMILVLMFIVFVFLHRDLKLRIKPFLSSWRGKIIISFSMLWLAWTLGFPLLYKNSILELLGSFGYSYISYGFGLITKSNLPFSFVLELLAKLYLPDVVYVILGIVISSYVLLKLTKHVNMKRNVLMVSMILIISGAELVIFELVPFGLELWRFIPYVLLPSLLLMSYFGLKANKLTLGLIVILVVVSQGLGMARIYESPWTNSVNLSLSNSLVASVSWFSRYEVTYMQAAGIQFDVTSAVVAVRGPSFDIGNLLPASDIPNGLNYSSLTQKDLYLLAPFYSQDFYQTMYPSFPEHWIYTPAQFKSLESNANVLYESSGMSLLLVNQVA